MNEPMRKCNSDKTSSCTQSDVVSTRRGCCLNLEFLWHSGLYAGDDMAALRCFYHKRGSFLRSLLLEKSHLLSRLIIHLKVNYIVNIVLFKSDQMIMVGD